MIGNNDITVNQATMISMAQEWFDRNWIPNQGEGRHVKVTRVEKKISTNSTVDEFIISLSTDNSK